MTTIWIKHPETGGVSEVLKEALPIYRQSGWDLMSDDEVTARQDAEQEQARKDAERLERLGQEALGNVPPPDPEVLRQQDAGKPLPSKSAPKPEWEQAARDRRVPEDEITNSTKDQLVARLTGNEE